MKKIVLLISCILFISCTKQKENIVKELPLGEPGFFRQLSYSYDNYEAFVCVENAEIKKEPRFDSEKAGILKYSDKFDINQCWYSDKDDGFWCYDGWDNGKNGVGWVYSKDLNIPSEYKVSTLSTDGITRVRITDM